VVNFDDYAVVIVKSFSCNNLRANEYSAVTLKPGRYKDMRRIGPFSVAPPVCAREPCAHGRTVRRSDSCAQIPFSRYNRFSQQPADSSLGANAAVSGGLTRLGGVARSCDLLCDHRPMTIRSAPRFFNGHVISI
jgi:hypothetical protein